MKINLLSKFYIVSDFFFPFIHGIAKNQDESSVRVQRTS